MAQWRAGCDLDPDHPINWDWEGNVGLAVEWAATSVTGWRGPNSVREIVRRDGTNHDAAYAAIYASSPWMGSFRPAGSGSFVQTDPRQYLTSTAVAAMTTTGTYIAWVCAPNGWSKFRNLCVLAASDANHGMNIASNGSGGAFQGAIFDSTLGLVTVTSSAGNLPTATPVCLAMTFNPSGMVIYQNGVNVGSASLTTPQNMSPQLLLQYSDRSAGQADWTGPYQMDDALVFETALTAGQVAAVYAETRAGNPNRWRRLSRTAWFLPSGGGATFQPAWAAGRGVILGAGGVY